MTEQTQQYLNIDDADKIHLLKLIDWLFVEVTRAGGDGDALWFSKYYSVKDLYTLVNAYNNSLKYPWDIRLVENDSVLVWYDNQEFITISNKVSDFENRPSWQQVTLVY